MAQNLEVVDYLQVINQFQTYKFHWDEEKETHFYRPAKEKGNYK